MNEHLKLAYDHGVQQALVDAGLTKEAVIGADATYGDLVGRHTPESRQLSRTLHGGLGAGIGGLAGAGLGGMGAVGLANLLTRGKVSPSMLQALGKAGATTGGIGGLYAGGLQGTELSMENDPALMRYLRAARRNIGLE